MQQQLRLASVSQTVIDLASPSTGTRPHSLVTLPKGRCWASLLLVTHSAVRCFVITAVLQNLTRWCMLRSPSGRYFASLHQNNPEMDKQGVSFQLFDAQSRCVSAASCSALPVSLLAARTASWLMSLSSSP